MKRKTFLLGWLLLAIPAAVQAQFTYTVTNQTVTITEYVGASLDVAIPSTINGLPVTSISPDAFCQSSMKSVTIPDSVRSIGDGSYLGNCAGYRGAFFQCTNLGTVTIPNSVTDIGDFAFARCSSLTNLTLGRGVASIGASVFRDCTSLTSVTIPTSVTSIGDYAFYSCTSLTNIMVDPLNSAYSSVAGVLFNQTQTTLLTYPGGKLGDCTIPNSVTKIADGAFGDCTNLTSVTIPSSVTIIRNYAFDGCYSLTNLTLGSGVASIGESVFRYCTNLTSVTIPNSVANIGDGAFIECSSLTNLTLGSGVTSIGGSAFGGCTRLSSVTIPNSVTDIGDFGFAGCTGLKSLTLGSGVTSIGFQAFHGCRLSSVTIPNSVTYIGDRAFSYCTRLTSVYFQGNAPSLVGTSVFDNDFATIYYLQGTTGWGSTFAGRPTALWRLPYPLILTGSPSFGVRTNQLGFTVSWATNLTVVVEAASDLANPLWSPVQTNTLASGSFYFSDPLWTHYPSRFYGIRSQ